MNCRGDGEEDHDGAGGDPGEQAQHQRQPANDLDQTATQRRQITVGETKLGLEELSRRLQPVAAKGAEQFLGHSRG